MSYNLADVKRIFLEVLAKPTAEERLAHVEAASGGNAELRQYILDLLHAHDLYATPVPDVATQSIDMQNLQSQAHLPPGTIIGGKYKIIELISDGGMGSVYRATRTADIRMEVALKVIKPGLDSEQVLARFNIEKQALR